MSTDFYVWSGPWLSADEFGERLRRVLDDAVPADRLFRRDARIASLLRAAQSRFPPLRDLPAAEARRSPWAADPVPSDVLVELNLRPSARQADQVDLLMMAFTAGLLVYDPQAHRVVYPRPPIWRVLLHVAGVKRLPPRAADARDIAQR